MVYWLQSYPFDSNVDITEKYISEGLAKKMLN